MSPTVNHLLTLVLISSIGGALALPARAADLTPPRDDVSVSETWIDLLPADTVVAVELRDLSRRWSEIRSVPAIARLQDRWLGAVGIDPHELPGLLGDRVVFALVMTGDSDALTPVALLPTPPSDAVVSRLSMIRLGETDDSRLALHRTRDALWIGPAHAAAALETFARPGGDRDRLRLSMRETNARLPEGGLVRGWIDPAALRAFVERRAALPAPHPVVLARSFLSAELEPVRYAGFRRDLTAEGIVTDAVIGFDPVALPDPMARVLRFGSTDHSPLRLPAPWPRGAALAWAFRTEPEACRAWLWHVVAREPRGPLRNLGFWLDEFRERTGRDLERDLVEGLGDQGWWVLLEERLGDPGRNVAIFEARDPQRLATALLRLRSWLAAQAWGRTLGLFRIDEHDERHRGAMLHGVDFRTPFAELPGPAFAVVDGHLVVGTGRGAVIDGLDLVASRDSWPEVVASKGTTDGSPSEAVRIRGSELARWLEMPRGMRSWIRPRILSSTLADLLAEIESISVDVGYGGDAVRLHGVVRFIEKSWDQIRDEISDLDPHPPGPTYALVPSRVGSRVSTSSIGRTRPRGGSATRPLGSARRVA